MKENHPPASCKQLEAWEAKEKSDGDNLQWIKAHAKPCPHCGRYAEKVSGCNFMTCAGGCGKNFCWICLRKWEDHVSAHYHTGTGKYNCDDPLDDGKAKDFLKDVD